MTTEPQRPTRTLEQVAEAREKADAKAGHPFVAFMQHDGDWVNRLDAYWLTTFAEALVADTEARVKELEGQLVVRDSQVVESVKKYSNVLREAILASEKAKTLEARAEQAEREREEAISNIGRWRQRAGDAEKSRNEALTSLATATAQVAEAGREALNDALGALPGDYTTEAYRCVRELRDDHYPTPPTPERKTVTVQGVEFWYETGPTPWRGPKSVTGDAQVDWVLQMHNIQPMSVTRAEYAALLNLAGRAE